MATIVFNPGLNWSNIPASTTRRSIPIELLAERLEQLRCEWEEATGGQLESVTLNLRMLLEDIERMIESGG